MHDVSQTYQDLFDGLHTVMTVVEIETEQNGETVYEELEVDSLFSVKTDGSLFPSRSPSIGNFCAKKATIALIPPDDAVIPRMARIRLFVYLTDGSTQSERIQKGTFWIDTRSYDKSKSKMTVTAYDAALKFDSDFDSSSLAWPAKAEDVVTEIAQSVGVELKDGLTNYIRTFLERDVPLMPNMTKRDILRGIATMFCANWTITDDGKLDLVPFNTFPESSDTVFLADEHGNRITIGGDRIIVR